MKISVKKIVMFIMPAFLIVPEYFLMYSTIKNFFLISKATLIIGFMIYFLGFRKKISKYNAVLTIIMMLIFLSTILNRGNIKRIVSVLCSILSLSYYVEFMCTYDKKLMINSFCLILGVYVVINFILMIMFPTGMYTPVSWENIDGDFYSEANWLLGFKNHHLRFFFPLIYFLYLKKINHYYKSEKKMNILLYSMALVIGASAFMGESKTVIGGFILFLFIYIMSRLFQNNVIKIQTVIIINIIIFVFLIFFGNNKVVLSIVDMFFGKAYTFSQRLTVWSKAISSITKSAGIFLLGYGKVDNADSIALLGYNNTHNSLLEIIYQGGIVCFILFIYLLYQIYYMNKEKVKEKEYLINAAMLITILTMMQVETMYFENTINVLFTCMYLANYLIYNKGEEK